MVTTPTEHAKSRDGKGRFAKGTSGNPGGRPVAEFSFTNLLRARASERPKLVDRLLELAESEDENVALRAILGIANRLDGMPRQAVDADIKGELGVVLRWDDGEQA